jgi:hypothetical protein
MPCSLASEQVSSALHLHLCKLGLDPDTVASWREDSSRTGAMWLPRGEPLKRLPETAY